MVFFLGNKSVSESLNLDGSSRVPPQRLPPIVSLVRRQNRPFNMQVERRISNFADAKCRSYFNGTLHVMGRLTTQNLYHACK